MWLVGVMSKRLNVLPSASTAEELMRATSQPYLPEAATSSTGPINPIPQNFYSPLDQRAIELSENLKLLKVQVQSVNVLCKGNRKCLVINQRLASGAVRYVQYRKIPKISPGAYIFQRPFLRGLFLEGLIYGGEFAFQNRLD